MRSQGGKYIIFYETDEYILMYNWIFFFLIMYNNNS